MWNYNILLLISFFSASLSNVNGSESCGTHICKAGQVCESSVDGGTCYNSTARIDCSDGISYCYEPRVCCGVSTCCPANSECCGLNTCCPKGAVCCSPNYCCESGTTCCGFDTCCAPGSYCEGGICRGNSAYDGPVRWWYTFFFLFPLMTVLAVIIRRRRRTALLRAAAARGNVIVAVPVQTRTEQYGYDQGPISYAMPPTGQANPNMPQHPSCPPPPYSEVATPKA